jgi:LmbE family N-acetylglucosaminyl deacetylase
MIQLNLTESATRPLTVLCLGAHSDDIEIGCGGSILRLREQYPAAVFHWVVFSANEVREAEARRGATLFGGEALRDLRLEHFRDGFLPFVGAEVKEIFESLKSVSPDLIFSPCREDAHQDHQLIGGLAWNTFRDHLILEYEIPKYDGDMGQPGVFFPLETGTCQRKVQCLLEAFQSQRAKRWFEEKIFFSLLRLRGMECNSPSGYAEAFHCRKLLI